MSTHSSVPRDAHGLVERYLELLAAGEEDAAVRFARSTAERMPPEDVVLDVIAPAQARVGRLWQCNAWPTSREHTATHISERALAAVVQDAIARRGPDTRGSVVVACVDGEWHALPARLLADVLRLRGWRVDYLGSSVPEPRMVAYLYEHDPDAVALSCTLSLRLPTAHGMIQAAHRLGLPVLAGGRGFGPDRRLADLLGADAWAGGAREAARILEKGLVAGEVSRRRECVPAIREYIDLRRRRGDLLQAGLRRSTELYADADTPMGPEERDRTVEDLGHLVDFLAVAVYVADPRLLTDFLRWMREVLEARSVPFRTVLDVLDCFEELLAEHRMARAVLREARAGLAE